jgi:hypothetical protein
MEDFEVFLPTFQSSTFDYVMELWAQLRPSGQILDHFRIALDSSAAISKELDLGQLILAPPSRDISIPSSTGHETF